MIKRLSIDSNVSKKSLEAALLPRANSNFFENFRAIFHSNLTASFIEQGLNIVERSTKNHPLSDSIYLGKEAKSITIDPIKVTSSDFYYRNMEYKDVDFCIRAGNGIRGIEALNYVDTICKLPSLSVLSKIKDFSLGNFHFSLKNVNYDIEIEYEPPLKLVGYSQNIYNKKSGTAGLVLAGIYFQHRYIVDCYTELINNCACTPDSLDEIYILSFGYPIMFVCRICGKLYSCKCFEDYFSFTSDISRLTRSMTEYGKNKMAANILNSITFKKNICHLCTKDIPRYQYGAAMYYSAFLQSYLPYFHLYTRKFPDVSQREAENRLRDDVGHVRVGEKWTSETKLYAIVQKLFPTKEAIFHYRGEELQGLELDIWVPDLRLGFEYQGIQHYEPVEHWGGEAAFKKLRERDELKRTLCKALSYTLVEVPHDIFLNEENVAALLPAPFRV